MSYEVETIEEDNEGVVEAECVEIDTLDDDDIEQKYKDELDDLYGTITIGDCTFSPSQIMEECDPTAFSVGLSNAEENLQETEEKYVCPDCGSHHDDEDDATYCCQERTITRYEVDGESFDEEDEAQDRADELNEEESE